MTKRFIGDAVVDIRYLGHISGRDEYAGHIKVKGYVWKFAHLFAPSAGFRFGYDSSEAYDRMAETAISFGAYYTTANRGADLPNWAPSSETADAINEATICAMNDNGHYSVIRKRKKR